MITSYDMYYLNIEQCASRIQSGRLHHLMSETQNSHWTSAGDTFKVTRRDPYKNMTVSCWDRLLGARYTFIKCNNRSRYDARQMSGSTGIEEGKIVEYP